MKTKRSRKKTKAMYPAGLRRGNREHETRVAILHDALNKLLWMTRAELAALCGCSRRSVSRELYHMREEMLLPIEHDCIKGLRYTEKVDVIPNLLISERVFFTLMLALKSIDGYRTDGQKRSLGHIFNKLSTALRQNLKLDIDLMDECLSFGQILRPRFNPERIDFMWRAAVKGTELKLVYDTPNKGRKERVIRPLHVRKLKREWITFCYDSLRDGVIRLALGRMQDIRTTGRSFRRPKRFKVNRYLKGAMDVYTGEKMVDVAIYVAPARAHLIRENDVVCEIGRKDLPCGGVELHLRVSSFVDLLELLGEFRGDAVPLSPPELVKEYLADCKKGAAAAEAVLAGTFRKPEPLSTASGTQGGRKT